jgi:hypothetical protein
MTIAETIEYRGYTVEIHYDEDAYNPLAEFDGQPALVLHAKAEGHFGWTNDEGWADTLNGALDRLNERYPKDKCLAVIQRWLAVFKGVPVVLPVGAGEHSGTWVYLGSGASFADPGGWDSGWVGWLFWTPEKIVELTWAGKPPTTEKLEEMLIGSFKEFANWVSGETFGYVIVDPDGGAVDDDSCWGFYGHESYTELDQETTIPAYQMIVGWRLKMSDGSVDTVVGVEDEGDEWSVDYAGGGVSVIPKTSEITLVHPGYMREQFTSVIDQDIEAKHQVKVDLFKRLVSR